jgi:hypothetical protein
MECFEMGRLSNCLEQWANIKFSQQLGKSVTEMLQMPQCGKLGSRSNTGHYC